MTRSWAAAVCGLAVGLTPFAGAGHAQIAGSSRSPVDITADQEEVLTAKCVAIWRGSAEALQDTTRLRAEVITVYAKAKSASSGSGVTCGGTDRIEAEGHVFYVTPTQTARADRAVYTADSDLLVLTGDVIVVQGKDVTHGDRLVIHVSTKQAQMDSAVVGRGQPGRVRGVFYPNQPAQAPTPPAGG
ncbi:MAG: LptA/OstA family protein [Caulobacterales bacterium]